MSFLSALGRLAGRAVSVAAYPITKPTEALLSTAITLFLKNFLFTALRGLLATALAALTAFAATPPQSNDHYVVLLWGFIVTGIHALISAALKHIPSDLKTPPSA